MRRPAKFVLQFLIVVAVATAVTVLYGPPSGSNTPYMSALSDVTLGTPALAACPFTGCSSTLPVMCVSGTRLPHRCVLSGNGTCTTHIC